MTIENIYRNRTMNEITEGDVGQTLKVAGWAKHYLSRPSKQLKKSIPDLAKCT